MPCLTQALVLDSCCVLTPLVGRKVVDVGAQVTVCVNVVHSAVVGCRCARLFDLTHIRVVHHGSDAVSGSAPVRHQDTEGTGDGLNLGRVWFAVCYHVDKGGAVEQTGQEVGGTILVSDDPALNVVGDVVNHGLQEGVLGSALGSLIRSDCLLVAASCKSHHA